MKKFKKSKDTTGPSPSHKKGAKTGILGSAAKKGMGLKKMSGDILSSTTRTVSGGIQAAAATKSSVVQKATAAKSAAVKKVSEVASDATETFEGFAETFEGFAEDLSSNVENFAESVNTRLEGAISGANALGERLGEFGKKVYKSTEQAVRSRHRKILSAQQQRVLFHQDVDQDFIDACNKADERFGFGKNLDHETTIKYCDAINEALYPNGEELPPYYANWTKDKDYSEEKYAKLYLRTLGWLAPAVKFAYLCHHGKKYMWKTHAQDLLATKKFTERLDDPSFLNGFGFRMLRSYIEQSLQRHGQFLKELKDTKKLQDILGGSSVKKATKLHKSIPIIKSKPPSKPPQGYERFYKKGKYVGSYTKGSPKKINQAFFIKIKKTKQVKFDFLTPEKMHERVYLHCVLMVAHAVNHLFHENVRRALKNAKISLDNFDVVQVKSYVRAANKIDTDYRYERQMLDYEYYGSNRDELNALPLSGFNIDVARCMVQVDSPAEKVKLIKEIANAFDGVAKIKNLFDLSEKQQAERFYLLTVMLTVVFDAKMTYGQLLKSKCPDPSNPDKTISVTQLWDDYESKPEGEALSRWQKHVREARTYLSSPEMANERVMLSCEIQTILKDFKKVRSKMHFPYKALRNESAEMMRLDFAGKSKKNETDTPEQWIEAAHSNETQAGLMHQAVRAHATDNLAEIIQLLKETSANFDVDERLGDSHTGQTPLFMAAQLGFADCARVLLKAGADAGILCDNLNGAPVPKHKGLLKGMVAGSGMSADKIKNINLLLLNSKEVKPKIDGITPFAITCFAGHLDIAQDLLNATKEDSSGGDGSFVRTNDGETVIGIRDSEKRTPLIGAAIGDHSEVIEFLIDNGAPLDTHDVYGRTALYCAASEGAARSVKTLLARKADPRKPTKGGHSPLYTACESNHEEIVKLLLTDANAKHDINKADLQEGLTPLMIAVLSSHMETINLLLEAGADKLAENKNGETALHVAARINAKDPADTLAKSLKSEGISVDIKSSVKSKTPLHYACAENSRDVYDVLVEFGADTTLMTDNGSRCVVDEEGKLSLVSRRNSIVNML